MRLNSYLTILHVSILAATLETLEADSEDSGCEAEIKVRRNTAYNASVGEELRINCTVEYCNSTPPAVSWFKIEKTTVPVNVSSSSHIRTEWTQLKDLEGISFLIFKNILRSDSGVYECCLADGLTVSHVIKIFVYGDAELTTARTTSVQNSTVTGPVAQDTFWPFVCRLVGIMVFVAIVIIIFVIPKSGCKGVCCVRRLGNTPDSSRSPSHIYENDQ